MEKKVLRGMNLEWKWIKLMENLKESIVFILGSDMGVLISRLMKKPKMLMKATSPHFILYSYLSNRMEPILSSELNS